MFNDHNEKNVHFTLSNDDRDKQENGFKEKSLPLLLQIPY